MGKLFNKLQEDIRFTEGLKACMNCGICTAICPAADFFDYDPRIVVDIVQSRNDDEILDLLKGNTIWYCGQCMSCKTRCPRGNVPGLIINALRELSQEMGYFTESEQGRQQLAIKRTVGQNILKYGYCIVPEEVTYEDHPEQGPIWEWLLKNYKIISDKLGGNYKGNGSGGLRKISEKTMNELENIFEITGGNDRFDKIEHYSGIKAEELGFDFKKDKKDEYFYFVYNGK